jgi:hypothetical protein
MRKGAKAASASAVVALRLFMNAPSWKMLDHRQGRNACQVKIPRVPHCGKWARAKPSEKSTEPERMSSGIPLSSTIRNY